MAGSGEVATLFSAECSFFGPSQATIWFEEQAMRLGRAGGYQVAEDVILANYFGLALGQTLYTLGDTTTARWLLQHTTAVATERAVIPVMEPQAVSYLPAAVTLVDPGSIAAGTMATACSTYAMQVSSNGEFFVEFSASSSDEYYLSHGFLAVLRYLSESGLNAPLAATAFPMMCELLSSIGWRDGARILEIPGLVMRSLNKSRK